MDAVIRAVTDCPAPLVQPRTRIRRGSATGSRARFLSCASWSRAPGPCAAPLPVTTLTLPPQERVPVPAGAAERPFDRRHPPLRVRDLLDRGGRGRRLRRGGHRWLGRVRLGCSCWLGGHAARLQLLARRVLAQLRRWLGGCRQLGGRLGLSRSLYLGWCLRLGGCRLRQSADLLRGARPAAVAVSRGRSLGGHQAHHRAQRAGGREEAAGRVGRRNRGTRRHRRRGLRGRRLGHSLLGAGACADAGARTTPQVRTTARAGRLLRRGRVAAAQARAQARSGAGAGTGRPGAGARATAGRRGRRCAGADAGAGGGGAC